MITIDTAFRIHERVKYNDAGTIRTGTVHRIEISLWDNMEYVSYAIKNDSGETYSISEDRLKRSILSDSNTGYH